MRRTSFFGQTLLPGVLAVAVFSQPMLIIAQDTAPAGAEGSRAAHERADGNITGRVSAFTASGTLEPARARVYFVQKGKVMTSARSDEEGRFQASGLEPGVYSVLAVGRKGFGVLSAAIRSSDEGAAKERSTVFQVGLASQPLASLDITLIPAEEFGMLAKMFLNEIGDFTAMQTPLPSPATGVGAGDIGGGADIDGGGFRGLLETAGLAADVAALATKSQASPSTP